MKKAHSIVMIVVAVILALCAVLAVCWDVAEIYLMPRTVVKNAAETVYAQLRQRFEGNPILLAASYLDEQGRQSADVELFTSDLLLGDLRYKMQIQTQPGQIQGCGTAYSNEKDLDLSFYADKTFMAVSSQDLLQGSYYGITYDTFLEDVRSIPLLSWMIGESVLQKWNQNIHRIQNNMDVGYPSLKIPKVEEKDLQRIFVGMAAVPVDVERVALGLQDQVRECYRVSFEIDDELAAKLMGLFADTKEGKTASACVRFYLNEQSLIFVEAYLSAGDLKYEMRMEFGKNNLYDPLRFFVSGKGVGEAEQSAIQFSSVCRDGKVEEQWYIDHGTEKTMFSYEWNPANGDMLLKVGDAKTFALNMAETEYGLTVQSNNLSGIYHAITGKEDQYEKVYSGTITVREGSDIVIPEYKNLDQWSLEDFLILLEGIGSLIGLQFF